jgi:hemerythrin
MGVGGSLAVSGAGGRTIWSWPEQRYFPRQEQIMAKVDWSKRFVVGHGSLDTQHQVLFGLLERAQAGLDGGPRPPDYRHLVLDLLKYVVEHFGYEYDLMHQHAYPDQEGHHADHQRLVAEVVAFKDLVFSDQDARTPLVAFLSGWVEHHIGEFDRDLANFLNERGVAV